MLRNSSPTSPDWLRAFRHHAIVLGGLALAGSACAPADAVVEEGAGARAGNVNGGGSGAAGSGGGAATGESGGAGANQAGVASAAGAGAGGMVAGAAGVGASGQSAAGASTGGTTGGGSSMVGGSTTGGGGSAGGGASAGAAGQSMTSDVPLDPALRAQCTGTNPIVCHLDAADGNWDVTVDLGSDAAASNSRLAVETRHFYGDARAVSTGQHLLLSLTANVRAEKHDGGQSAPANVLDLTIDGSAPALRGIGLRKSPSSPTVFVAGDSTLCDWVGSNSSAVSDDETGWAQALPQYFGPGIAIANYADSGETAASFYTKFFPQARTAMKAGDYLFVQFGHNDQKDTTAVADYKANLLKYVNDARGKQATPVLFSPVSRSSATDTDPGFAGLDQQVRELAAAEKVAFVDLTALSRNYYKTVPDKKLLFADSGTHLSSVGATAVAGLVAKALGDGELPLKAFLR